MPTHYTIGQTLAPLFNSKTLRTLRHHESRDALVHSHHPPKQKPSSNFKGILPLRRHRIAL